MFRCEVDFFEPVLINSVHKSCQDGDVQTASYFLKSEPLLAVMEDPYNNWTPIHFAARCGKLECIREVASVDPSVINIQSSKTFQTSLHCAAAGGHADCVLWLLQAGTNPDVKDNLSETALHKAARVGSYECVRQLALATSKVSAVNHIGQTASAVAEANRFPAIADFLRTMEGHEVNEFPYTAYRPLIPLPRRKRMRDEICGDDFCKKRRTDDISVEMHNLFGVPDTINSMDSSLVEHDRLCWVEYGYKNTYMDTMLSEFHGC